MHLSYMPGTIEYLAFSIVIGLILWAEKRDKKLANAEEHSEDPRPPA